MGIELTMSSTFICCPSCGSNQVAKRGKTNNGTQRYSCLETNCLMQTFILDYSYNGCVSHVKQQILAIAISSNNIRNVALEQDISSSTVIKKKKNITLH
jgi:transposase-like protein